MDVRVKWLDAQLDEIYWIKETKHSNVLMVTSRAGTWYVAMFFPGSRGNMASSSLLMVWAAPLRGFLQTRSNPFLPFLPSAKRRLPDGQITILLLRVWLFNVINTCGGAYCTVRSFVRICNIVILRFFNHNQWNSAKIMWYLLAPTSVPPKNISSNLQSFLR